MWTSILGYFFFNCGYHFATYFEHSIIHKPQKYNNQMWVKCEGFSHNQSIQKECHTTTNFFHKFEPWTMFVLCIISLVLNNLWVF
jgi:hypothetical protein